MLLRNCATSPRPPPAPQTNPNPVARWLPHHALWSAAPASVSPLKQPRARSARFRAKRDPSPISLSGPRTTCAQPPPRPPASTVHPPTRGGGARVHRPPAVAESRTAAPREIQTLSYLLSVLVWAHSVRRSGRSDFADRATSVDRPWWCCGSCGRGSCVGGLVEYVRSPDATALCGVDFKYRF